MVNFLLALAGGAILMQKEEPSAVQRTVAGVLLGVGLARALDDVSED